MVKVSVVVPVYNVEKYLEKCLDSLVNQTLQDIEIICVDDGSTDDSLQILNKYSEKYNKIKVLSQRNLGVSAARNLGMKIAQGEYIGFVDSDDWIDYDYYEKLYEAITRTNSDLACCSIKRMYPNKESKRLTVKIEKLINRLQEKFDYLKMPSQCFPVNKLYKKSILDEAGLKFIKGRFFEDIPFSLNAILKFKQMVTVPDICYYYRSSKKSIMRKQDNTKRADMIWARNYALEFERKHCIKVAKKDQIKRKKVYLLFGIPILKVYEWETECRYLLFGFIPIMRKVVY